MMIMYWQVYKFSISRMNYKKYVIEHINIRTLTLYSHVWTDFRINVLVFFPVRFVCVHHINWELKCTTFRYYILDVNCNFKTVPTSSMQLRKDDFRSLIDRKTYGRKLPSRLMLLVIIHSRSSQPFYSVILLELHYVNDKYSNYGFYTLYSTCEYNWFRRINLEICN